MKEEIPWYFQGTSGKHGNKVYYLLRGNTFVRRASLQGYNKIPTEKQAAARQKFTEAVRCAREAMQDPALKAFFEILAAGRCTAYAKAISYYLGERHRGAG